MLKKVNKNLEKKLKMCYTLFMTEPLPAIPSRSAVGGWSVDRYVRLLRPWVVLAGLGTILLVIFQLHQVWVSSLQFLTYAWVGWLITRRGGRRIEALAAGAMTGLSLGSTASICRFVLTPSAYWLINILFETLLFGFLGAMISLGVQTFFSTKKLSN